MSLNPFPLSLIISQNYQLISFLAFPDGRLAKSIPRLMTNEDGLSKIVGDVMYALILCPFNNQLQLSHLGYGTSYKSVRRERGSLHLWIITGLILTTKMN